MTEAPDVKVRAGTKASQFFISHRRRVVLCAGLPLFWMTLLWVLDEYRPHEALVFLIYLDMAVILAWTLIDDAFRWIGSTGTRVLMVLLHVAV